VGDNTGRFPFDYELKGTDNFMVEQAQELIYSPLDQPPGLRRGYSLSSCAEPGEVCQRACRT